MIAARYFDLIREMKHNTYNHRLRLVESARQRGIKPTARLFSTTAPTVRKWLRRFQQHGPSGLRRALAGAHTTSLTRRRRPSRLKWSRSARPFPLSALAASFANSICPSVMTRSNASGAGTD